MITHKFIIPYGVIQHNIQFTDEHSAITEAQLNVAPYFNLTLHHWPADAHLEDTIPKTLLG